MLIYSKVAQIWHSIFQLSLQQWILLQKVKWSLLLLVLEVLVLFTKICLLSNKRMKFRKVKHVRKMGYRDPFFLTQNSYGIRCRRIDERYRISAVVETLENRKLVGLYNRDMRFIMDYNQPISAHMTVKILWQLLLEQILERLNSWTSHWKIAVGWWLWSFVWFWLQLKILKK